MNKKQRIFAADFETTVYTGQEKTEVWAGAFVELNTATVTVVNSIDRFMGQLFEMVKKTNLLVYFHNLKFDGSFIISWLINQGYKDSFEETSGLTGRWKKQKDMENNSYSCCISNKGQWYFIKVKKGQKVIEFRDSLKLLPFKLKDIADAFDTEHKKLEIEYTGRRYAGWQITPEEQNYIENDVLVLKEALEYMFAQGHSDMTIASCCKKEFVSIYGDYEFKHDFPNLYNIKLTEYFGEDNADAFIRKSYRGGWCYVKKGCENRVFTNGITLDVNSLYSSVMHSDSGNVYPVGKPYFWRGAFPKNVENYADLYYFVKFQCKFKLKKNHLPTVQIKDSFLYPHNEYLETSDIYDKRTGNYYSYYCENGKICDTIVTLTMTKTDFELFKDHYNITDFHMIGGCYFYTITIEPIFDRYIDKYKKIKMESTGAARTLAKLFLNSLYGRCAIACESEIKRPYLREDGALGFINYIENLKKPWSIALGAAITAYARDFTIRTAQKNYKYFIYADTDSLHCNCSFDKIKGVELSKTEFLKWDLELQWQMAIFVRQKTYIEVDENGSPKITCAGMGERPKALLKASLTGEEIETRNEREQMFVSVKRELTDFRVGLTVPSNLKAKQIQGGVLLVDCEYIMRKIDAYPDFRKVRKEK